MEQAVVVKTEMQANGDILLFYVDENGGNAEGVLTTVQHIENQAIELQQDNSYILPDVGELSNEQSSSNETWSEDEIKRLLVFYNDNKQAFISGTTKKKHLWTVACKTMLLGKNPSACEIQFYNLRMKYFELCSHIQTGVYVKWPYFELCHQVFNDEQISNEEYEITTEPTTKVVNIPSPAVNHENVMVVKKVNNRSSGDEKVEMMLHLYLKYKKSFQQEYRRKGLWEAIALELGEDDGEYWQKRFLNYKQHYLRLLDKRRANGSDGINWPYMKLFDKIFEDDEDFSRKYISQEDRSNETEAATAEQNLEWDNTEITVLAKYYYDCFDEFEDKTIPNSFLWNEIGRLLDKTADVCKQKFEELKQDHLQKYIKGGYDLRTRKPVEILLDNIISKEIESKMTKMRNNPEEFEQWKTEELDELVNFFYENVEMYKDMLCHYVCWAAMEMKLKRKLQSCISQWEDLKALYKTILNDKKENPDMQIDWRYIELFDRIFDYGMDNNLLIGYDKLKEPSEDPGKIAVRKIKIKKEELSEEYSEDESFDEKGYTKSSRRGTGESKAFKILEYYQKHKDKLSASNRNKHTLWDVLGKQIGISATQCAHRFRNLKQVYTAYVQREINKPEMPILWPYYALCKKVFGYRAIKTKLKNGKLDSDDSEDWSAKEIKQLINYFSQNFDDINNNTDDSSKWSDLASDLGKGEMSCKDKFLELRKSFRKLKTMRSRNPDVKISWKYFNMFEQIYNEREENNVQTMDVDGNTYIELPVGSDEKIEEDDYQCIIVIPEGEDIENAQIIIQEHPEEHIEETEQYESTQTIEISQVKAPLKWTKRTKKLLLIHYINYIRMNKGKEIKRIDMWKDISSKLKDKTPLSCRKMFAKLKTLCNEASQGDISTKISPYHSLVEKVLRLQPKFVKTEQSQALKDGKIFKDVTLPDDKVLQALEFYLENIEAFTSPRFEKKYLWTELATYISEPANKIFNKINYLKQFFVSETDEVAGQKTPFAPLLKQILTREIDIKLVTENEPKPIIEDSGIEVPWSDEETEQLLEWYLSNLDKFKNPKFVRAYLWMDASIILNKGALACSKKMSEIRTQYRNMVRENAGELSEWRFLELCQKIYGTGKRSQITNSQSED